MARNSGKRKMLHWGVRRRITDRQIQTCRPQNSLFRCSVLALRRTRNKNPRTRKKNTRMRPQRVCNDTGVQCNRRRRACIPNPVGCIRCPFGCDCVASSSHRLHNPLGSHRKPYPKSPAWKSYENRLRWRMLPYLPYANSGLNLTPKKLVQRRASDSMSLRGIVSRLSSAHLSPPLLPPPYLRHRLLPASMLPPCHVHLRPSVPLLPPCHVHLRPSVPLPPPCATLI